MHKKETPFIPCSLCDTFKMMDKKELKQLTNALLQLQKGDVDALETVYNLTRRGVFTFVLPIMGSKESAEDITQTTYVHLYEKIDQYDKTKNPLNWILTMAKNIALTEVIKQGREISTDFMESVNGDRVFTYDSDNFDAPTLELANKVLTPSELQIVMMFAVAEYKHREIAEILDLPLGTVTWKYNAALKKLRLELEKNGR